MLFFVALTLTDFRMSQVYREYHHKLLIIIFLLLSIPVFGQDKDIEDVKKRASEFFEQEDYTQAKELYSQLVSLYPKDENFNYRFGACLLFVDEDKTYPLKFLEYAVSRPNVDDEAFYFLGKGYHYNYRFDEAIRYFEKYKSKIADLKEKKFDVDSQIRFCKNGKKLMRDVNSPRVISKKRVGRNEFFTSFKMSEIGGRTLFAPKELQSSVDKKKGYTPVMYRNSNSDIIFFTSYGPNEKNGIDIYSVTVQVTGELSKPVRLPETINTEYDEGFPFYTEEQDVFYFASKGHNSMGGYDLFKADYNANSQYFANVVNLDYAINTPDDDLMYADLGGEGVAYFASNRNCGKGKVYVYQINSSLERFEIAALSGVFSSPATKSCKITVEDLDDHMIIGAFNTDKNSGEYLMRLKNGGRYKFLVEPYGSNVAYQGRVELPDLAEMKLLKQEIEIVVDGENEKLIIRNLFEESPTEEDAKLLAQVLIEEADIDEEKAPEITISGEEMSDIVKTDKEKLESYLGDLRAKSQVSYHLANQKRELAQKDLEMAEQLESQVSLNDNSEENRQKQEELTQLMKDAKTHSMEAEAAFNIGKNLEAQAEDVEKQLNKYDGYIVRIDNANDEGLSDKVEELFQQYKVDSEMQIPDGPDTELKESLDNERAQVNSFIRKAENITVQQNDLREDISFAKAELKATKKKKEKAIIQQRIDGLYEELAPLENQKEELYEKSREHELLALKYENELEAMSEIAKSHEMNPQVDEASEEQKDALINSIVATNEEIIALESSTSDKIKERPETNEEGGELAAGNNEIENAESNNEESGSELTAENTEVNTVENESEDSETGVEESENGLTTENNEEENSTENVDVNAVNPSEVVAVDGQDLIDELPEDSASVEENVISNGEDTELVENNSESNVEEANSEIISEESGSIDAESTPLSDNDVFEYTAEYESPSDNAVEVGGAVIPLDITSNTGKREYKVEELKDAEVVLDESSYNEDFKNDYEEVKQIEDSYEKAKQTQSINYDWVVAIEKEVAELSYAKTQTDNEIYKSRINDKIQDLNSQATQKRNFMALNARIIKQLENQSQETAENTSESNQEEESENSIESNEVAGENTTETENGNTGATEVVENSEGVNAGVVVPVGGGSEELEGGETVNAIEEGIEESNSENIAENNIETESSEVVENNSEEGNEFAENNENTEMEGSSSVENNTESIDVTESESSGNVVENTEANTTEESELANEGTAEEEGIAENTEGDVDQNANEEGIEETSPVSSISNEEIVPIVIASIDERNSNMEEEEASIEAIQKVEVEKMDQSSVVAEKESTVDNLTTELELTKKKKERRALEQRLLVAQAEVEYEQKKMQMIEMKTSEIQTAEESIKANPLSERPSEAKYQEARSYELKADNLQMELDELEEKLSQTKKKKHRRVIEAEIQNVRKELKLSQISAEVAKETAVEMEEVEILTLKKHTAYGEEEMVKLPEIESNLTQEDEERVKELEAYVIYKEAKDDFDQQISEADVLYQSGVKKNEEAIALNNEIKLLNEGLDLLPREEQDSLRMLIVDKKQTQKKIIAEADVFYQQSKEIKNEAYFNLNEANSELLTLDDNQEKTQILALLSGKVEEEVPAYDSADIDAIPVNLVQDIFVDSDTTFYSETKPIPVDVQLPEGVILKVQIGAFRNPIKQETFKGFAPIVGERTSSGLTRYTAGLFKDFASVNAAKDGIRAKGYSDAFVVAYLNGQRISIAEARRLLAGEISEDQVATQTVQEQQVPQSDVSVPVQTVQSTFINVEEQDVQVSDVNDRGELYFTVQVGVYSANISPKTVLSLSPLNQERIPNNLVRYSSGVYGSLSQAIVARNLIVQNGISDAFVTAYYQGERITISRAKELAGSGTTTPSSGNTSPVESTTQPEESGSQNTTAVSEVTYFVQVGPYTGSIPVDQARIILGLSSYGVIVEKNNDATLYKIGNFTNRSEAETLREDLVSKGLVDPIVVESE